MKLTGAYYGFAILFILALDGIWLSVTGRIYTRATAAVQHEPVRADLLSATAAYGLLYTGMVTLALPNIVANTSKNTCSNELFVQCLRHAGVLGAVIYGVYNFTNKALLRNYPWHIVVMDTLWGTVMMTLAAYFTVLSGRAT